VENSILSTLVNNLIIALVPVLIGALGYLARAVVNYVKARTTAEHYAILQQLAIQAVQAAEQTLKSRAGEEKLAAAKSVVTAALLSRGIRLDEEQITAAIEAAVYVESGIQVDTANSAASISLSLPEFEGDASGVLAGGDADVAA
jgi:LL-H family phage holin